MDREEGWRLYERPGERSAVFCRLEHVVPWSLQGARFDLDPQEQPEDLQAPDACAECGAAPDGTWITLVRHREEHRIQDCFCSLDHLSDWAKAGGRWR